MKTNETEHFSLIKSMKANDFKRWFSISMNTFTLKQLRECCRDYAEEYLIGINEASAIVLIIINSNGCSDKQILNMKNQRIRELELSIKTKE